MARASSPSAGDGRRIHQLEARDHQVSGFERVGASLGYRETGDPVAGVVDRQAVLLIGLSASLSWGFARDLVRDVRAQPDPPVLSMLVRSTFGDGLSLKPRDQEGGRSAPIAWAQTCAAASAGRQSSPQVYPDCCGALGARDASLARSPASSPAY